MQGYNFTDLHGGGHYPSTVMEGYYEGMWVLRNANTKDAELSYIPPDYIRCSYCRTKATLLEKHCAACGAPL